MIVQCKKNFHFYTFLIFLCQLGSLISSNNDFTKLFSSLTNFPIIRSIIKENMLTRTIPANYCKSRKQTSLNSFVRRMENTAR